jgi:hypothetical protein
MTRSPPPALFSSRTDAIERVGVVRRVRMRDAGRHQRDVGIADVLADLLGVGGARPLQPQSLSFSRKRRRG